MLRGSRGAALKTDFAHDVHRGSHAFLVGHRGRHAGGFLAGFALFRPFFPGLGDDRGRGHRGLGHQFRRDAHPKGAVFNPEDIRFLLHDDRDIGRHAGLQLQVLVAHIDDRRVGNDALLGRSRVAHLPHAAGEGAVRERVHRELHFLTFGDAAHVGFGDGGVDLHLGEIVHQREKDRCVHARIDGAAFVGLAVEHHAVDRRGDHGAFEIELGVGDGRLAGQHGGVRLRQLRVDAVELLLGNQLLLEQVGRALGVDHDQLVAGLGRGEIGFRLAQALDWRRLVDAGEHVALFDDGIVVDQHFLDLAGNLGADVYRHDRLQISRGRHRLRDVTPGDLRQLKLRRLFGLVAKVVPTAAGGPGNDDQEDN